MHLLNNLESLTSPLDKAIGLARPEEHCPKRSPAHRRRLNIRFLVTIVGFITTIIVAANAHSASEQGISVESLIVVDCLLPGQVRNLGRKSTFITPRRPVKTSARNCAIRGGEYVSFDRANYQSALKVWLVEAESGDAKAQTYVAEIYERGLGTNPDYTAAARWYLMAAKQGYKPAKLSLGRLHEQGLGVEKNLLSALNYYREANDLDNDELGFVSAMRNAAQSGTDEEIASLRKKVKSLEQSNEELRRRYHESLRKAENSSALLRELELEVVQKQRLLSTVEQEQDLSIIVNDLRAEAENLRQQLAELNKRSEIESVTLRQEIASAEQAMRKAEAERDSMQLVALMKKQLEDQQLKLELREKNAAQQLRESQAVVEQLNEELRQAKSANDSSAKIAALQLQFNEQELQHQQRTIELQNVISDYQAQLQAQQEKYAQARNNPETTKVITLLRQQVASRNNNLAAAEEKNTALHARLRNEIVQRERQAKLLADQASAKKLIANLKSQVKKQSKQLQAETKRNQELVKRVNIQAKELADIENQRTLATAKGPTIILKVPPLIASRGANEVNVQPGQQVYLAGGVVAPDGVKSFTLNGEPAILDVNNLFMLKVDIQDDELPLELKIIDSKERATSKNLVLKPTLANASGSYQAPSKKLKWGNYHALVIGNNEYSDPKWSNLKNAVNDATALASILKNKYGFEVTLKLNASRIEILEAIEQMRNKLTDNDNLLIYYAGHGQRDDANNRAYWIPVDSTADSSSNWIPSYQITDHVNAMNARHVLLVVDSCYAGLMTRSGGINAMRAGMTKEQKQQKIKDRLGRRSRMLITAGDNTEVLDAGRQGMHSIFAEAFIGALRNNQDVLDSEGVFKIVQPYVSKHTYRINKQSVVYAPIPRARHEGGEFYFAAPSGN